MCSVIDLMEFEFTGELAFMDSNVWNRHIDVPDQIVQAFKEKGITRLICTFDNSLSKHCALLSHGNGTYFVMLNQEECKKLGVERGRSVQVQLKEDKSTYGMPMPEEMAELLQLYFQKSNDS